MQFLLTTALYCMEPWERMLVMSVALCIIALVAYTAIIYIPLHIHRVLQLTIPKLLSTLNL